MNKLKQAARKRLLWRRGLPFLHWRTTQFLLGYDKTPDGVVDRLDGLRLEYDPRTVIGRQLFVAGAFEDAEIGFFRRLLASIEAPVVLDVGANIGVHAIRWAKAHPDVRVMAIEPSRHTVALLRKNVASNGLADRIEVVQEAMSDRSGTGTFHHCDDDAYSSLKDTRRKAVVETYEVRIETVDAFVRDRNLARVDLLKIDVEGLEGEVLRGAQWVLANFQPHLFVEIFGGTDSNPDPAGTVAFVCAQGYDAFVLKDGLPEAYEAHADAHFNYYFRPQRQAPAANGRASEPGAP